MPSMAMLVIAVACAFNAAIAHNLLSALWIDKPEAVGRVLVSSLVGVGLGYAVVECIKRHWGYAALDIAGVFVSCLAFFAVVRYGHFGAWMVDGPCSLSVQVLSDGRFSVDGRQMDRNEMATFSLLHYRWCWYFNRHVRENARLVIPDINLMASTLELLNTWAQPEYPRVELSFESDPPFGIISGIVEQVFVMRDGDEMLRCWVLGRPEYYRCPTKPSVFSEDMPSVVIGMDIGENGEPYDWWHVDHCAVYSENEAVADGASPIIRKRYLDPEMVKKASGAFVLEVDERCPVSKFKEVLRRLKQAGYTWIFVFV